MSLRIKVLHVMEKVAVSTASHDVDYRFSYGLTARGWELKKSSLLTLMFADLTVAQKKTL